MSTKKAIAILGTGMMGNAMGLRLLETGHSLTAWNRNLDKTKDLAKAGAKIANSPKEACSGAEIVITMLSDAKSTLEVMDNLGAIEQVSKDAIWIQMATVGSESIYELEDLAKKYQVQFLDCPVSGTVDPARSGNLVILASGQSSTIDQAKPVLQDLGKSVINLGPVGAGSKMKLVLNDWLFAIIAGLSEAIALSKSLGLDPNLFLEALSGGPLDTPYAHLRGKSMIEDNFPLAFTLEMAAKDVELINQAGKKAGIRLYLAQMVADLLERAVSSDSQQDLGALYRQWKK